MITGAEHDEEGRSRDDGQRNRSYIRPKSPQRPVLIEAAASQVRAYNVRFWTRRAADPLPGAGRHGQPQPQLGRRFDWIAAPNSLRQLRVAHVEHLGLVDRE